MLICVKRTRLLELKPLIFLTLDEIKEPKGLPELRDGEEAQDLRGLCFVPQTFISFCISLKRSLGDRIFSFHLVSALFSIPT